ncbi:hypothetical protein [Elstera cyanobacteriorum]|uniref:Uncharacterized protein n=1 Tax=Elstera cyanobacteriorum TaxID=2022747 RepID=A0A255XM40_9PROT|nr:hypothetical protein [Elstera cyanobacteriorum]MCK6444666.1 hypothetical protein [Elstera cyanobacteriorum]OYQ17515.1 hypothetical protein CHR90_16355 [Elstera cyanobacteriorum]GFZ94530.1 hypothetical protein GCM10011497_25880 [Elstera cyanobacteriorum]
MFGFSFAKLLVLVAVCVAGWYLLTRARAVPPARRPPAPEPQKPPPRPAESAGQMEDLRKCTFCDIYVPVRNARSCGRPNCPHAP